MTPTLTRDLTSPIWIIVKGSLFLLLGLLAGTLLILRDARLQTFLILTVAVWAFCRFYYFAFYVIEHYIDPSCRFSGLLSLFGYLIRKEPQKR